MPDAINNGLSDGLVLDDMKPLHESIWFILNDICKKISREDILKKKTLKITIVLGFICNIVWQSPGNINNSGSEWNLAYCSVRHTYKVFQVRQEMEEGIHECWQYSTRIDHIWTKNNSKYIHISKTLIWSSFHFWYFCYLDKYNGDMNNFKGAILFIVHSEIPFVISTVINPGV